MRARSKQESSAATATPSWSGGTPRMAGTREALQRGGWRAVLTGHVVERGKPAARLAVELRLSPKVRAPPDFVTA